MTPLSDAELIQRLLLAAACGGVLGFEREIKQKSAGLRTNMLISLGSAMFTLMSYELADGLNADPTRIAAQIVTGIGFLGAGAIIQGGSGVRGLTTGTGIWVAGAIGLACGAGYYLIAGAVTAFTLMVLIIVGGIERRFMEHDDKDHG